MTDIVGKIQNTESFKSFYVFSAAFLKTELARIVVLVDSGPVPDVEKLTGDSSKSEKDRVMQRFRDG